MASKRFQTIPTINENKKGKHDQYVATVWNVPDTPLMVNISPGHEDDDKPYYVISHKHTGYAVLPCGRMTLKSSIEAAQVFFTHCPAPIKVLLEDSNMDAETLQKRIDPIMKNRRNKTDFNVARQLALNTLKGAR